MKKYIILILIISGLVLPMISFAGNFDFSQPLVQCGTKANPTPCTLCDLFSLVQRLIDFLSAAIFIIAGIIITIGGLMILLAGANPGNLDLGKKMIKNAVIGVIISLLAWTVINMIFVTLVSKDSDKFPAPWNEIKCVGGGVVEATNLTFCHIQYRDQNDVMFKKYDNNTLCSQGCKERCAELGNTCENWCCLDRNENGKNDVCSAVSENQWCKRSAPAGSEKWKLTSYIQNPIGQKGDASTELTNLLNCMYDKIPTLEINAISSNVICNNPVCDPLKESCGHGQNSCHFGGTKCTGFSYAVDFNTNITCSNIADTALSCNSSAWILWEDNHTHVSIYGKACGCAENQTAKIQCGKN